KQMASKTSKKAGTKKSQAQPGPDLFTSANVSGEDEAELHSAAAKHLRDLVPPDWHKILADEFTKPYFAELAEFVAEERKKHTVYPPENDVFNALKLTPFDKVKVFLLGQDPYHGPNQAHGLAFSVKPGVPPPPSLVNIFKEL